MRYDGVGVDGGSSRGDRCRSGGSVGSGRRGPTRGKLLGRGGRRGRL
jgi:hypothetical protein